MHTKSIIQVALVLILVTILFVFINQEDLVEEPPAPIPTPELFESVNEHGKDATYSTLGAFDLNNPFFQDLGSNGRTCLTCHVPSQGWTITPKGVQTLFDQSEGLHALFRLVDGANSPLAEVETVEQRRDAYSMLLNKANIRVGIGIPEDAEFTLIEIDDPYDFASETELSLFRRPLPTTNLKFVNAVMWEGRETTHDTTSSDCIFGTDTCFSAVSKNLATQSNNATLGHAEALQALTTAQRVAIVEFETSLFTAQITDDEAGDLTGDNARGGPVILNDQEYHFGINDTIDGDYQTREDFNPVTMTIYDAWDTQSSSAQSSQQNARAAIARGQKIFNEAPIQIRGVSGLNDALGKDVIPGTCTTCHNTPNAGNHAVPLPLDIGISNPIRRTADMPLYTLQNKKTGETVQTMDPGRALITGKWEDMNRFKGPTLRAIASRPPYFHDGSAADIDAVVNFYVGRFGMPLTQQDKADLVAFLAAL